VQATAAGAKDQEATSWLEKRHKGAEGGMGRLSYEETVQTAIEALQHVLAEDLKAGEIEVGVVAGEVGPEEGRGGRFRVMAEAEVEEHLVAISERD